MISFLSSAEALVINFGGSCRTYMVWTPLIQYCKGAAAQDRQTSLLLPLQQPRLCHLFPFPTQCHPSVCLPVCLRVDAQAETCRRQDKAGLVSVAPTHRPAGRKPGMRSLHGSFIPPQLCCGLTAIGIWIPLSHGHGVSFPVCCQHSARMPAASPRARLAGAWLSRCIRV